MDKLRILAVGAHPDDLEILCGGTLSRYSKLGHTVIMSNILNGDKGHYSMDSVTLVKVRKKESENSAKIIGAIEISIDIPDGQLFSNLETRIKIMDLIRSTRPDVILTHSPNDYMSDHTTTSQLVCDASFLAASPLFKTKIDAHNKIPPIFFIDTVSSMNFLPTEYVDISDTFETKREMLRQHESQLIWLKEHDNIDILESIEIVARFRGLQCGVKYAECFCPYDVSGRRVTKRLLP
ncbi:MAG: PIG-L family deacetylase [Elusimicrobia bacterium]|nr:PIG-L family deacetylase [Elusimicrobiota bacterium]